MSAAYAAEKKEESKAAPAPAHAASKPAGAGGAGGSHGPTTSSHGPTTASHGPTTASHGPTTSTSHTTSVTTEHHANTNMGHPAGAGGRPGGASAFAGHPAARGGHELHAANGAAVRTRADGSRSDIHDPKRGMDIHHGLDGSRRISVERADHSRIVAERGGRGFVQHPYNYHGREFGHRTYYEHGRAYDRFYGRYPYHGRNLDVYAPARFYPYGFYGYAYAPWPAPVPYAWAPAPWYGAYGYYYAPYPVYASPAFWITDFVVGASLAAAYEAGHEAGASGAYIGPPRSSGFVDFAQGVLGLLIPPAEAAANGSPVLSPEVKNMVADEIKIAVQQEGAAAQANSAKQDVDPASSSIVQLFSDGKPHVFVGGSYLDLVSTAGQECAFGQGDVLRVDAAPAADDTTGTITTGTILASKNGNKECAVGSGVSIAVGDLQDMHNHLLESVDDGLAELQKKGGKGGLPAPPASAAGSPVKAEFAADAPPADVDAGKEIAQQASDADSAEKDAVASVSSPAGAGSSSSTTISVGQSIDEVTATLGAPTRIIDLGAKKIYTYPDMKITFLNGKVNDVN